MAGEDKESVQEQACGCVVLASGKGTRFGGGKLHALFRGKPLIQWALSAVPAELTDRTVVVVGDETIRSLARRHGFRTVENNAPEQGISHSIQLGLAPLQEWCGRVLFLMADQPMLRTETIRNALRLSEEATDRIVALAWNGRRRNPCIFPAKFFPELMSLTGDQGGNAVAARHPSRLLLIEAPWEETEDIDDQETLARLSVQSELRIDPLYPEITMRLYMQIKCFGPGIAALLERVRELIGLGARIQINAGAIMGGAGNKVKKFCRQVMEEDLLHFIASDAHGIKYRYPNLGECAKYVTKKMGASYAEKIFRENPEHILDDARRVRKQREGRKNLIERAIAARSNKKT